MAPSMDGSPSSTAQYDPSANEEDAPLNASYTHSSESSLDSTLRRYFRKEGEVRLLQEKIADVGVTTRSEQDGSPGSCEPDWNIDSQHDLSRKLRLAQEELSTLKQESDRLGLDVEGARWRDQRLGSSPVAMPYPKREPVQDWIQQTEPQEPVFGIPQSRYSTVSAQPSLPSGLPVNSLHHYEPHTASHYDQYYSTPLANLSLPRFARSSARHTSISQPPHLETQPVHALQPYHHGYSQTPLTPLRIQQPQNIQPRTLSNQYGFPHLSALDSSDQIINLSNGLKSRFTLIKPDSKTERKYGDHKARPKPRDFFRIGRVFETLWTEPCRELDDDESSNSQFHGNYMEPLVSEIRRFVVIEEFESHCVALTISSYEGMGVAQQGVSKSDHGIIYTGGVPFEDPAEYPKRGESGMRSTPVQVSPNKTDDFLPPMSRINYAKMYTIEHGLKVKPFGRVRGSSLVALVQQFQDVHKILYARVPRKAPDHSVDAATAA